MEPAYFGAPLIVKECLNYYQLQSAWQLLCNDELFDLNLQALTRISKPTNEHYRITLGITEELASQMHLHGLSLLYQPRITKMNVN